MSALAVSLNRSRCSARLSRAASLPRKAEGERVTTRWCHRHMVRPRYRHSPILSKHIALCLSKRGLPGLRDEVRDHCFAPRNAFGCDTVRCPDEASRFDEIPIARPSCSARMPPRAHGGSDRFSRCSPSRPRRRCRARGWRRREPRPPTELWLRQAAGVPAEIGSQAHLAQVSRKPCFAKTPRSSTFRRRNGAGLGRPAQCQLGARRNHDEAGRARSRKCRPCPGTVELAAGFFN